MNYFFSILQFTHLLFYHFQVGLSIVCSNWIEPLKLLLLFSQRNKFEKKKKKSFYWSKTSFVCFYQNKITQVFLKEERSIFKFQYYNLSKCADWRFVSSKCEPQSLSMHKTFKFFEKNLISFKRNLLIITVFVKERTKSFISSEQLVNVFWETN